jgi:hypothetical protein
MGYRDPREEGPDAITICIVVAFIVALLCVGWQFESRDRCMQFGQDHNVETRYIYGECRAYFPDGHIEVAEQ